MTRDFLPRAARIIEVGWEGHIGWEWMPAEHFEAFGHSEAAQQVIMHWCRNQYGVFLNTASYVDRTSDMTRCFAPTGIHTHGHRNATLPVQRAVMPPANAECRIESVAS
jgi:hypothetical protein